MANSKMCSGFFHYFVISLLIVLSTGCYYNRSIYFKPEKDFELMEDWTIHAYVNGYTGKSKIDPSRHNDYQFKICATTRKQDKLSRTISHQLSEYKAQIVSIRIFLGTGSVDEAAGYNWSKEERSDSSTCWSPASGYLKIPFDINELTIAGEVGFFLGSAKAAEKNFRVKMKRRDETKLVFDGR